MIPKTLTSFFRSIFILCLLGLSHLIILSCECAEVTKFYAEIVQVYSENIGFGAYESLHKNSESDSLLMRFVFEYNEWETKLGKQQNQLQAASCPHPQFELNTKIEGITMFLMRDIDGKIEPIEIDSAQIFVYYEKYEYSAFRGMTEITFWQNHLNFGIPFLAYPWFIVINNLSPLKEGEFIKTEFVLENGTIIVAKNVSNSPPN